MTMNRKVSAVLLRVNRTSVYLAQRLDPARPYYRMFAPPGGKFDDILDSNPKACALRELREETRLEIAADRLVYIHEMDSITPLKDKGSNIPFTIFWYGVDLKPGEEPKQTEPTKQGAWIPWTLKGALELSMPPGDATAIQMFLRGVP